MSVTDFARIYYLGLILKRVATSGLFFVATAKYTLNIMKWAKIKVYELIVDDNNCKNKKRNYLISNEKKKWKQR